VEQKGGKEAKGSKAVNEDNNDTTPKPKDKDGNGTKKKGESSSLLRSTYVDVG
jgi:hypothetical protein